MERTNRRLFLQRGAGALVLAGVGGSAGLASPNPLAPDDVSASRAVGIFAPQVFQQLPLGSIRPAGWLQRQMRLQADGMGGHLDEFWPDVGPNSGWLGGTGESWERGPYFLDGLIPLAWQLDDPVLKAKALRFVNWTLEHQQANGMIGPATNDDWWPRMVMVKALAQYAEASGDPRVEPVLTRYFHYQLAALPGRPLREWGRYRWQDESYAVAWLYVRTGDPKLRDLARLLQAQGFDWVGSFRHFTHTGPTTRDLLDAKDPTGNSPAGMETHGVNNGQALKTAAVQYRWSGDAGERANFFRQLEALDRYHGQPTGMFSCDEHLAGLSPSQGTELCTVVETMFSLEVALAAFGDAAIADRLERIAYNALPGTFTNDMWAHQYDQQANQVACGLHSKPWTTNGPESNLYGLAPHFGCCTANFHQGWPKLTASLWMRTAAGEGLAATVYAPCEVQTQVRGQAVHLREETEYPFRETVRITVTPAAAMRFPLHLRIPAWAHGASVQVNGTPADAAVQPGSFVEVKRTWQPGDVLELRFPMRPVVTRGFQQAAVLSRGPLVFSLQPGASWVKLRDRGPAADWQVYPQRQWNYALRVDESSASTLAVQESPVGAIPFSAENPGVRLRVPARVLDSWRSEDGVAAPVPASPQQSQEPEQTVELIPYGAAKLRITAFPTLQA